MTDADVDSYYKTHPDEFTEVHARHILIGTSADQGEKEDADKADDKKSKPLTKDEARKKAESILDRIHKGEDFGTLAKENSDDPGSKTSGSREIRNVHWGRLRRAPTLQRPRKNTHQNHTMR